MKVSDKMVKEWDSLREHGDVTELAKILKLTRSNTSTILNSGEGRTGHIGKIIQFYRRRKKEQAKLIDDNN